MTEEEIEELQQRNLALEEKVKNVLKDNADLKKANDDLRLQNGRLLLRVEEKVVDNPQPKEKEKVVKTLEESMFEILQGGNNE